VLKVLSLRGRKSGAGFHRALSWGPCCFFTYIDDFEDDVVSNVFKFAYDTKSFRQVRDTVDTVGMQEDLDRLVERADKWQMQLNVSKCKVMHVGKKNLRHSYYKLNSLKSVEVEKDYDHL